MSFLGPILGALGSVGASLFQNDQNQKAQQQQQQAAIQAAANQNAQQLAWDQNAFAQSLAASKEAQALSIANQQSTWEKENAAAISAAALSQKYAHQAERRAAERDATKIQTLVKDANAAGIHPLAALGVSYGGPMGQAVQASTPSHSSVDFSSPQMTSSPVTGAAIGDAILNVGFDVFSQLQNMRVSEAQIKNLEASTANILSEAQSRTMLTAARLGGQSLPSTRFDNTKVTHDPGTDDAQKAANRYGEPGDWLFGSFNLFNDTNTLSNKTISPMTSYGEDFGKWMRSWF